MTEEHTKCEHCNSSSVIRIPSLLGDVHITSSEKVGDIVNKTIEETKEEVRKYKKELKNKGYKK